MNSEFEINTISKHSEQKNPQNSTKQRNYLMSEMAGFGAMSGLSTTKETTH